MSERFFVHTKLFCSKFNNKKPWTTGRLKEYIIKGFTMDDERLKDPRHPLFYEMLVLIDAIRTGRARERNIAIKLL